ncbi:sodium/glutamate symporter [Desnuesiella massiliensis]|uniref:sodium/glutamate symporter n=1 Tax=Desnuesiella massiliensis TaxID=1650662 RepID=UPI0006E1F599|nr:sodium/glutamate symporter [Desnuesiella massiliensis]
MNVKLDMIQTVALAIIVYYLGLWVKGKVALLEQFCIPAPVVGGLIFAILNLFLRQNNILILTLDTTLQNPFMLVFFTSIGLGASLKLIRKGGLQVVTFFIAALLLVILQNALGIIMSKLLNVSPLLGLIAGSITMTGGHGTGATWGALFEKSLGFHGATTAAMAAATFGLVSGSLIGGPIGRTLINKYKLISKSGEFIIHSKEDENIINYSELFRTFSIIVISIALGSMLEILFKKLVLTLPSYINAMIIAAIILNLGENTGKWHINIKCVDILGNIGLNIFLSMALINLQLWQLKDIAGPMLIILLAQTILMILFAYFITFKLMGKDYDAAVIASGHCGFGMGATPNGIANMEAITEKFGLAPKAFFILPIVGAFLIDFANSIVITIIVNLL